MSRLFASVRFTLVAAGQNFTRNFAVSMAGVFTMGLILLLVGSTLLLTHTIDSLLDQQQAQNSNIKIYLQDSGSLRTIADYEQRFEHDSRVLSVGFTSKDQAAIDFKDGGLNTVFTQALTSLGSNPLPSSIDLKVHKLSQLGEINSLAETLPIVDTASQGHATDYNPTVIPRLQSLIAWIFGIGLALSVLLAVISLVIIMNTIRTAVYIRRTEVEIMKLVGATDWFVRWPFILEGVFGGVLAAALGSAVVGFAYRLVLNQANTQAFLGIHFDGSYLATLIGILMAVGASLGAFGSYLGVRRFLNV